ncbi:MAG TPA: SDR family oxidoreductase [Dongiaceae bacterium]|nr:SDR family oxidoreductase [Dongiaceae bacterium]
MEPKSFEKLSLKGKVAVVTGGTQGLGEAVAHLFADRGAAGLVICGRNRAKGQAVAAALGAKGAEAHYVAADLAELADCRAVVAAAERRFGRLDSLVNVAAVTDRGTIWDTSPELFDRIFAVNVRAPFFLMQDALKLMRRNGTRGTVVNILSMSGHGGQPFITAYCASKGALITLTKNVAFGVMRHGIRVNGLCIGWMDTPGEDRIMRTYHGAGDGWLEKAEAALPMGRMLKTDEVARAVAYLASEESGMMTGSIVDFDQQVAGCYEAAPQPAPIA